MNIILENTQNIRLRNLILEIVVSVGVTKQSVSINIGIS